MSWVAEGARRAREARERAESRPPAWTIRFVGAEPWSQSASLVADGVAFVKRLWAVREGDDREDLALMSTVYEARIMAWCQTCEDGKHAYFEFDPEIESLRVQRWHMTPVMTCLKRNGIHGHCREERTGREYDF